MSHLGIFNSRKKTESRGEKEENNVHVVDINQISCAL